MLAAVYALTSNIAPQTSNIPKTDTSEQILNVRAEMAKRRTWFAAAAEAIGRFLANPWFFAVLLISHLGWLVANLPVFGYVPLDPYPFTFLATVASVEAPFLSLLILMQQHRDQRISELRGEVDLQVALHSEREVTVSLQMLRDLHEKLEIEPSPDDDTLDAMTKPLQMEQLLDHLHQQLDAVEHERDAREGR